MRKLKIWIIVLVLLLSYQNNFASVWGQKVGKYFLSVSQTFYSAETIFDRNGVRYYLPVGGIFTKYETGVYLEYGLDNLTMLFLNLNYLGLSYRDSLGLKTNGGFGNQEAGIQFRIGNGPPVTAAQFLISFPFYTNPGDPPLGNSQVDVQAGILMGAPFSNNRGFWEVFFGFRKRFEAPADQLRGTLTVGFNVSKKIKLLAAANLILGLGNQDTVTVSQFSQNFERNLDFTLFKIEPSLVYKFNNNFSGFVGFTYDAFGRNVGAGYAFKLGVWYES